MGFVRAVLHVLRSGLLALLVLTPLLAAASTKTRAEGGRVYVNEMLVLTYRYGSSEQIVRRAEYAASKLRDLDSSSQLSLKIGKRDAKILVNDEALVFVNPGEAHEQRQSPEDLVTAWLENIRKALALPAIQIKQSSIKLALGGKATVDALGSEVETAELQNSQPDVAQVERIRGSLSIKAKGLGATVITLQGTSGSDSLEVRVLPYAVNLPQTLQVYVTGDPATSETVGGAVEGALLTKLPASPGTQLDYSLPKALSVPMSESTDVLVTIRATAPEAFPSEGKVNVRVKNLPFAYASESELWYCNNPETVRQTGSLFAAKLRPNAPARLLYHHLNGTSSQLVIQVLAINDNSEPAQLLIIPGDSAPDRNPVLAGFRAGDQFLRNWIRYSGEIVTLPAYSQIPISMRKLWPEQTMSGLCYLRLLGGGAKEILVRTDALSPAMLDSGDASVFASSAPWRVLGASKMSDRELNPKMSRDIYPTPFKSEDLTYRVGGKYGFAYIGGRAIMSADRRDALEGNFGVVYTYHASVVNPTAEGVDVELVFEASAGYSGALFVMNGNVVRTPILQSKEEFQVAKIHVDAGESKNFTFLTCPLSGSSYPATITLRPLSSVLR